MDWQQSLNVSNQQRKIFCWEGDFLNRVLFSFLTNRVFFVDIMSLLQELTWIANITNMVNVYPMWMLIQLLPAKQLCHK